MNLPQFTARHALYKTKHVYREYGASAKMEEQGLHGPEQGPEVWSGVRESEVWDLHEPGAEVWPAYCLYDKETGKEVCFANPPGGKCANGKPLNDPTNCGTCGHGCTEGAGCCNGICCGGGAGCDDIGYGCGCCNWTDPDGNSTLTCVQGVGFTSDGTQILQGQSDDPANCGTCGNTCGPYADQVCCEGKCCALGQACCGGDCTDLGANPNCGGCGITCSNCCTYQSVGQCCADDETCCEQGTCIPKSDFESDPYRCGGCDIVCDSGEICCNRKCIKACAEGQSCCNQTCTDFHTDSNNCGSCGHVCQDGKKCRSGTCLCADGQSSLDTIHNCGVCGHVCELGENCCNGKCANPETDTGNCGKCANPCPGSDAGEYSGENNKCFGGCCVNGPPSLSSSIENTDLANTNYWLRNRNACENILGLSANLVVNTRYLFSDNGYSLQLNAVPPINDKGIIWMQYVFTVQNYGIDAWIEYWGEGENGYCMMYSSNDVNWPCCSGGNCCSAPCDTDAADLYPSNVLPTGSWLSIDLDYDGGGNVSGANFKGWINFDYGGYFDYYVGVPGNYLLPIQEFQFVLVGPSNSADTQLYSAVEGTINYQVQAGQQLCVDGAAISCPGGMVYNGSTGETSNAVYGKMDDCCGSSLNQVFSV